ncbi:MAG: ABC transporter permease [Myxococcota bacterium]|nr:ABC transporter permease [Myxococcota bacterium]
MLTIIQLAFRNVLRNGRRSMLTAATVMLGCALLTIGLSWVQGIHGNFIHASVQANGHVRMVTEGFAARERLMPLYENIPDDAALIEKLSENPAVETVHPRIQVGVAASVEGNELGSVFAMLVGAPVDYFDDVLGFSNQVIDGGFFSAEDNDKQALIGRTLAANMGIAAGDEAIFLGKTQDGSLSPIRVDVVGVLDTGNGLFDKQVFVPLEKARWMADIPDGSIELLIFGADRHEARALMASIEPTLPALAEAGGVTDLEGNPAGLVLSSWDTREPFASLLGYARVIMGTIALIIVFITALGVLNTMLMSVLERTAEIGVLRAMGMKVWALVLMFVIEALVISAIGGALGVTLGTIASLIMESTGVDLGTAASNLPDTIPANRTLHPDWSYQLSVISFILGILMAFIGSASPAMRAARIQPVTAMRARR